MIISLILPPSYLIKWKQHKIIPSYLMDLCCVEMMVLKWLMRKSYRSIVGSLMFLTHTRPDIAYSVSLVPRYMAKPSEIHMKACKIIERYVKGTLNFGIHYFTSNNSELAGFNDSNWGGSLEDRNSTSSNCFSFGSGMINWSLKKKSIVSLSSTEAEYVAITSPCT